MAETERLYAFDDIMPQAPTHVLIIPKIHIADSFGLASGNRELVGDIFLLANQIASERGLAETGFRIVTNNGEGAGQSVFHLHFHLLGGRSFGWPPG